MTERDHSQIAATLSPLMAIFPNWKPEPESLKVYEAILSDIHPDSLEAAVLDLICEPREFMPTPGAIRQKVLEHRDKALALPAAYGAWSTAVGDLGYSDDGLHPAVEEAVSRIGGWGHLRMSTNLASERARFIDAYREVIKENHDNRRMLPQVKEHIALLAKHKGELPAPEDDLARLPTQQKPNEEEMENA